MAFSSGVIQFTLVHCNKFTDVIPEAPARIVGCHYHLLHEKHNQETGYPFDENIVKPDDFQFFMCYFLQKLNITVEGDIPQPTHSNNGQLELFI